MKKQSTEPNEQINKLNDFTKHLCSSIEIYPYDGTSRVCPTGEFYNTYTSNGIKKESEFKGVPHMSSCEAVENYIIYISALPEVKKLEGVLYWRKRPFLRYIKGYDEVCYACEELREDYVKGLTRKAPICHLCENGRYYHKPRYEVYSRFIISQNPIYEYIIRKYFQ